MRGRSMAVTGGLVAVLACPAPPASAAQAGILFIQGTGTISPGLDPVVPAPQDFRFLGISTTIGTSGFLSTFLCQAEGHGLADSLAAGAGTWSGACLGYEFTNCTYVRQGTNVTAQCAGTSPAEAWTGSFVFTPTGSLNGVTTFDLTGTIVGSHA